MTPERGERREKNTENKSKAAFGLAWEEAGQLRELASRAGGWGELVGLCGAASKAGVRFY